MCGKAPAGEDSRQLPADDGIVFRDAAGSKGQMDAEVQFRSVSSPPTGMAAAAAKADVALLDSLERQLLRLEHQAIAIHRPSVDVPRYPSRARIRRGGRRLSESDGLERPLRSYLSNISLVPPPAGISPTLTSTRPM